MNTVTLISDLQALETSLIFYKIGIICNSTKKLWTQSQDSKTLNRKSDLSLSLFIIILICLSE